MERVVLEFMFFFWFINVDVGTIYIVNAWVMSYLDNRLIQLYASKMLFICYLNFEYNFI